MSALVQRESELDIDVEPEQYTERYLRVVACFARGLLSHSPPSSAEDFRRLSRWCDELEDAALVLGAPPGAAAPLHNVAARF